MAKKKLIEVALPLDAINEGCQKEKNPFLKAHPRSLHLWWARRPLAADRAVLFAQLVDDPSSYPDLFPTEDDQRKERERLFLIIEELVKWENLYNKEILDTAQKEIYKSWERECSEHKGLEDEKDFNPLELPSFHDPFAGGGGIPLEAQRLGLESYASDLNPVAVLINKALLEFPSEYEFSQPVNPDSKNKLVSCVQAQGLKEDVKYYGKWMKERINELLSQYYPKVSLNGKNINVISWNWTRTVKCPNPACGCEVPLVRSFQLSKKEGNEAWIEPIYQDNNLDFIVHHSGNPKLKGTIGRAGATCPHCGTPIDLKYIRNEGKNKRMGQRLMAIVADGDRRKEYLSPTLAQVEAAQNISIKEHPMAEIPYNLRNFQTPNYGLTDFSDLYTPRQLNTLTELSKLVHDVYEDVIANGGSKDYAKSICVYVACGISQLSRYSCSVCTWNVTNENVAQAFGRQAIPMVWDFAEANPLQGSLDIESTINWPASIIRTIGKKGHAIQSAAQSQTITEGKIVSTDPPYYDNIVYSDLSDFFYMWLKASLKEFYPDLFSFLLVPKKEELVAAPYRFKSKTEAETFFLEGMTQALGCVSRESHKSFPITIFYAFKQSEIKNNEKTNTGWETFLDAVLKSGLQITGTWPIRTERTQGLKSSMNTLATSIVLVCRTRDLNAKDIPRRKFVSELKKELKESLTKLEQSNIAPVDLAQSAIGPGMSVFSKYRAILESDGSPMSVHSALEIINQEVDSFFNEQDADLHAEDRFCIDLYTQYGFDSVKYGEADTLARAKNTSVEKLSHSGTVFAEKGTVHLIDRVDLQDNGDNTLPLWTLTQQLVRAMDKDGIDGAAKLLKEISGRHESMRSLAYRLYTIAEKKNWAQEAYVYNNLVVAWPEIQDRLAEFNSNNYETQTLF